jgi:hypothetical protein
MYEHGSLPRARKDGLLVEELGEELLLYDQESHTAHCLSPIAACVWRHCDGEYDVTKLAQLAGADENLVADALHELREKDLLDAKPELMQSTIPGESRREAIGRVARYGAAAAAGSLIVSATAATPAMASSGEEAKKCVAKSGTSKSCCECTEDMTDFCIDNKGIITKKKCEEECAALESSFALWAMEGLCK